MNSLTRKPRHLIRFEFVMLDEEVTSSLAIRVQFHTVYFAQSIFHSFVFSAWSDEGCGATEMDQQT